MKYQVTLVAKLKEVIVVDAGSEGEASDMGLVLFDEKLRGLLATVEKKPDVFRYVDDVRRKPEGSQEIFSYNLIRIRTQNNLSQKDVAEMMGLSQACVSHWEMGRHTPPLDTIFQLAKALDVNPSEFLSTAG